MTKNIENLEYIKISGYSNVPVIKVDDVKTFLELVNKFEPKLIYLSNNKHNIKVDDSNRTSEKMLTEFLFYYDGIIYSLIGWNYNTIPDMIDGNSKGFQYGKDYYEAISGGFSDYKEYEKGKQLGYKIRADFLEAEKLGFRGKFDEKKYIGYTTEYYYRNQGFKSEAEIFYAAKKLGYKDFNEFENGTLKGFTNAEEYRDAINKGFKDKQVYETAKKLGFDNSLQYDEAIKLNIENRTEYEKYSVFQQIQKEYGFGSVEEAHIFKILSTLGRGKKLSASKLWEEFKREQMEYRNKWYLGKGGWYTTKFGDIAQLKDFLLRDIVKSIGYYDDEGEVFERTTPLKISDRIIIVDGSNVAWASGEKEKGDKPSAKNIRLIVDTLKNKGFEETTVIADASLRHQVDDPIIFNELKNEGILNETPAKTDADNFIIKYAKEKNAFIITNDTFRKDWVGKDPWVNSNIDKHRIPFMIINDVVEFDEKLEVKVDK